MIFGKDKVELFREIEMSCPRLAQRVTMDFADHAACELIDYLENLERRRNSMSQRERNQEKAHSDALAGLP